MRCWGALAVALLLIPGLAFLAYRKPRKTYRNRWLEKLTNGYNNQIKRLMERPKVIFAPLAAILVGAGVLSMTVGKRFPAAARRGIDLDSGAVAARHFDRTVEGDGRRVAPDAGGSSTRCRT